LAWATISDLLVLAGSRSVVVATGGNDPSMRREDGDRIGEVSDFVGRIGEAAPPYVTEGMRRDGGAVER
jgi:hypothetical protein